MRDHVVAVDVGTASVRAGVFDRKGLLVARCTEALRLKRPAPHEGVYASADIWQAAALAVRAALKTAAIAPDAVAGLAFGATCSLVLLDRNGQPLPLFADDSASFDTIGWFDHRARAEAEEITATGHPAVLHSGGTVSPEMQIPKLLWLKRNRPDFWARCGYCFDLADFLTFRATGSAVRSLSTLTSKWFFNIAEAQGFPADLLSAISLEDLEEKTGINRKPVHPGQAIGNLTADAAGIFGLDEGVVVAAGMIDAYAGARGAMPSPLQKLEGDLALIGGTSSCIVGYAEEPQFARSLWGPYRSALYPECWLFEAGQSATGGLLNHLLEFHSAGGTATEALHADVIERIVALIAENGPGFADGIDILPDFHGNRSPFADPDLTGMISGLTLDRSFDGLCRLYWRALVAIALSLRQILNMLDENGIPSKRLFLAGGHTRNPLLTRLYADVTGRQVVAAASEDAVLLGSAINAATASGAFATLSSAAGAMQEQTEPVLPDGTVSGDFDRQYERLKLLQETRERLKTMV